MTPGPAGRFANGGANAGISIVLSAGSSAGGGTAGAGTVTPPVPDAGTVTSSPGIFLISGNDFGAGIADGAGTRARFDTPTGLAIDAQGNLHVADRFNSTIRKIAADGTVSTLAGLAGSQGRADGSGTAARFVTPWGLPLASDGSLFVSDAGD